MKNILTLIAKTLGIFALVVLSAETLYTYEGLTILKNPVYIGLLVLVLVLVFLVIALDLSTKKVLEEKLNKATESTSEINESQSSWKNIFKQLGGSKPMEEEHEIILDHNYDGIKELDNNLPPWWVYSFYASIIFAVFYLLKYDVFDGQNQYQEYEASIAQAKLDHEEYLKTAPDLIDYESVILLTDASDLEKGKIIYDTNCVACHKADGGGGIGPNITDKYWILGGGIKNVFKTISEGGRDGKGMVAWKSSLKPSQIQQASSYLLSLQGTTPAAPKEPQGDIWNEE